MKSTVTRKFVLPATLTALAVLTTCCADDNIFDPVTPGEYTDHVCFTANEPEFEPDTRSGVPADCFVLHPEQGSDSLFVNTTIIGFDETDDKGTRAALTTSSSLRSFVVSAFAKNNGAWTTFFNNEENTREGDGSPWTYTSGNIHFWPGEAHPMRFCAYSPSNATGLTVNQSTTSGVPSTLTFNVQNDVAKQVDLLASDATDVPGNYNSVYPLSFKHLCTAVQFKEGADMQPGSLRKVELLGVYSSGTYSFDTGKWELNEAVKSDFAQTLNPTSGKDMTQQDGTAITDDSNSLIMMPQTLPDGAQLRITFYDKTVAQERVMTASIAGKEWPQGERVVYSLSITPDYKFEFTDAPTQIDAHYEIALKTLRVSGVPEGKPWEVKASLSAYSPEKEEPSIQLQSEMESYAKQGYWLDRRIDSSGDDSGPARGEAKFSGTGSGEFPIAIFVPENMSGAKRDVILEAYFNDATVGDTHVIAQKLTIEQLSPAPSVGGNFGWEQIDDNENGEYGFNWNTRYMYLIPYDRNNDIQEKAYQLSNALIAKYNDPDTPFAKNYDETMCRESAIGTPVIRNTYITIIDYSRLNVANLNITDNDGLTNTKEIMDYGHGAFNKLFQNALNSLTKANAGETDNTSGDPLFRDPSDWEINFRSNRNMTFDWETAHGDKGLYKVRPSGGRLEPGASIWGYMVKKNAYNLVESTTVTGAYVWAPVIKEIKWYVPAVDQFKSLPAEVVSPINPGECWSSTAVNGTDKACLGSGEDNRANAHKLRVCRNL